MAVFDGIATLALKSFLIFLELCDIFDEVLPMSIPRHDIKNFDLIICRLLVVGGTLLHLQSNVGVILSVPGKPNCRKVAPAEFLDNDVPVDHDFTDMHGVVAANLVVRDSLVLAHVAVGEELTLGKLIFESDFTRLGTLGPLIFGWLGLPIGFEVLVRFLSLLSLLLFLLGIYLIVLCLVLLRRANRSRMLYRRLVILDAFDFVLRVGFARCIKGLRIKLGY